MSASPQRQLREQNSIWLSQIIRGDRSMEKEPDIQINLSRFSFRVCRMKKVCNQCTKKLSLQSQCTCAYEHEYFLYVKADKTIDENMFDKILTAVRTGRCPHVKPSQTTSESSVTAKHAFAAIGNSDMIMAETTFVPTSCFGITPYHVAAIHKRQTAIQKLSNIFNFCLLQYPTKTEENESGVKFEMIGTNVLKLCIDRNDAATLRTILGGITNVYQYNSTILYAINQGKTESVDVLLSSYCDYMNIFHSRMRHEDSFQCTLFAVLSDRPESLTTILEHLDIQTAFFLDRNLTQLELAQSLGHTKCLEILENWQKSQEPDSFQLNHDKERMENQNPVSLIYTILFKLKFHNLRQFKTKELCSVLEKLVNNGHDVNQASDDGKTPLHYVLGPGPFFDILVCYTLLRLGADVNARDSNGEIPLFYVLDNFEIQQFYKKECLKWFIRMELYHNPLWCNIKHWKVFGDQLAFKRLENIYDGLCNDFIECGFLPNGFTETQPLQKICRTALRQAFPGTALHQFVQLTKIPPSIQDFILMKSQFDWQPHLELHS